ncbi:unnamed protein product, partial [Hapterophycus canaliculatus]
QTFQVNQKTKSGKWKCRMCSEGQSIVKVWGRGGHAKDVRGLVMELNAAAGRGENPSTALRSVGARSRSHEGRNSRCGTSGQDGDHAFPQHRQQHCTRTTELGPHDLGFVSANLASKIDDGATVSRSWDRKDEETEGHGREGWRQSWKGRPGGGGGYVGGAPARPAGRFGIGNTNESGGCDREQTDQPASASWQPAFEQTGSGSRWGVFASDRA